MKHAFAIFFVILCITKPLIGSDSPHWHLEGTHEGWKDEFLALQYFHHSELQRQWAWHLLSTYAFKGNEKILDFGCGDGKITAEIANFIPQGHILGVDLSGSMIAFASRCFPSQHYPNTTFTQTTNTDFNEEYKGEKYDLIYSLCVFHLIAHPVQVLNNLQSRLSKGGKLLLVIPSGNNPAFFQAANEIFHKYKLTAPWSDKATAADMSMRTQEGCVHCLKAAGFEPLSVVALHTPTAFFNKQELVEWMIGTVTANWQIPLEIAENFFNELIDRMAEIDVDVIDQSGAYHMKLSRIEVVATKKTTLL